MSLPRVAPPPYRRAPRLRPGDLVAVASPAGTVRAPRRLRRGVEALRGLGYEVRVGELATVFDAAERTAVRRAAELNEFFRDPEVRAVVCTIGGYTTNGVLDLLDYDALRADPKPVVGYSDLTALLAAVLTRAGVSCCHGPTLLPELAEFPEPLPDTAESLHRALTDQHPPGVLTPATSWTDEFLSWELDDDRPRKTLPNPGWTWLATGSGTGPLVGGNLETLCTLAGTRYFPAVRGAILLCETASAEAGVAERSLAHLAMLGVFDAVGGVVAGRTFRGGPGFETRFHDLLRQWVARPGVPVVAGLDVGHCDPMTTLPLGGRVRVDSSTGTIEVLDAAVE